jgi:hypothetical protein
VGRWAPGELPVGQRLREPAALFTKLDEAQVVSEELERLRAQLAEDVDGSAGAGGRGAEPGPSAVLASEGEGEGR